VLDQLEMNGID